MVGQLARRLYVAAVLMLGGLVVGLVPTPAAAQKMNDDGIQLPWFSSRAEKMARQACENDLPECRDSIRKKIATEKAITRTLPWILICLCLLGAARYARKREENRRRKQDEIARHHVRPSVREAKPKGRDAGDDDVAPDEGLDDGFGMGPSNKRGRR